MEHIFQNAAFHLIPPFLYTFCLVYAIRTTETGFMLRPYHNRLKDWHLARRPKQHGQARPGGGRGLEASRALGCAPQPDGSPSFQAVQVGWVRAWRQRVYSRDYSTGGRLGGASPSPETERLFLYSTDIILKGKMAQRKEQNLYMIAIIQIST